MTEATLSQLRANLERYCERAVSDRDPVRVRRKGGGAVVLLAAEEFESLRETAHLLASPRNAVRLLRALARTRKGTTKPMSVKELRATLGL